MDERSEDLDALLRCPSEAQRRHRRGFSAVMPAVVRAVRQKKATAMPRRSFPSRNQLNLNALFSAGSGAMGFYGDQGRRNSASNIPMGEVEMALGKTAIKGGLAALMVAAMSAGAFAWDAVATTSVNVRSGPGTQFRVVEVLQRGEVVDVEYCRNGWCFLDLGWNGNGWTSQRPAIGVPRRRARSPRTGTTRRVRRSGTIPRGLRIGIIRPVLPFGAIRARRSGTIPARRPTAKSASTVPTAISASATGRSFPG
jgi:hypothetical protein